MSRNLSQFRRFRNHARAVTEPSATSFVYREAFSSPTSITSSLSYFLSPRDACENQRRQTSSSSSVAAKNVTASAADRRLAGRRRFYKHVGIAACSSPFTSTLGSAAVDGIKGDELSAVESPISAGVDGTQSASGVHHLNAANAKADRSTSRFSLLQPKPRKEGVSFSEGSSLSWHTVTLDGRPIRTPLGLPLSLPSASLALAVATEWDAQHPFLRPAQMPLMTLCCTVIDQVTSDPTPHRRDVLRYLRNDTACYWADPKEDRVLHRQQARAWEGLHDFLTRDLLHLPQEVGLAQAVGGGEAIMLSRKSGGNPNCGLPHPPILMDRAEKWVESLDAWTLAALYSVCAEAKSFLVGVALVSEAVSDVAGARKAIERDAAWAKSVARLEEEFNIESWGLVEGGHDYDRLNCSIQMHAASFMVQAVANATAAATGASSDGEGNEQEQTPSN